MRKITLLLIGLAIAISTSPFTKDAKASGFVDGVNMFKTNIWNLKDGGIPLVSNAPAWMMTNTFTTNIWHQAVNAGQLWAWVTSGGGEGGDFISKTGNDGKNVGKRLTFQYASGTTSDCNYIVVTNITTATLTVVGSNGVWSAGNCKISDVAPGTLQLINGQ